MDNKKIMWYDTTIKTPKENLAINRSCVDLVKNDEYDLIARIYRHSKGVILGYAESSDDVNKEYCTKNGYEITTRPSGGSAIIVEPELNVSYTAIFKNKRINIHEIYQDITYPLAQKLGKAFSVEGNYYLRYTTHGKSVPIAGHAMKSYEGVTQFDGVIHLRRFETNQIDHILRLRELWKYQDQYYLKVNHEFFDLQGNRKSIDDSYATLIRSEKDELEKIIGLEDVGLCYQDFALAFERSLVEVFGQLSISPLHIDDFKIQRYLSQDVQQVKHPRNYLGHCFVDLVEQEQSL